MEPEEWTEIQRPWLHWRSTQNGNFDKCLSAVDISLFKQSPYLSTGENPLDGPFIAEPNILEVAVKQGVLNYFDKRLRKDFLDESGKLRNTPVPIRRWMAHLLWTTTINLGCPPTSGTLQVPSSVIYNDELSVSVNKIYMCRMLA